MEAGKEDIYEIAREVELLGRQYFKDGELVPPAYGDIEANDEAKGLCTKV